MPATYYFKVYFTKSGQEQPEIRRFAVSYSRFDFHDETKWLSVV